MKILNTMSEVKVTVTRNLYATLRHPKLHRHTLNKGIPPQRILEICTGHEAGRTDGQCDYYMPPKVPLGT